MLKVIKKLKLTLGYVIKNIVRIVPCKPVEQGFHSIRGFGAAILIAPDIFLTRNGCAVVKKTANYAAQFGAAI